MTFGLGLFTCFGRVGEQFFRLGHFRPVRLHQCSGDIFRGHAGHDVGSEFAIILFDFARCREVLDQTGTVFFPDGFRSRRIDPFGFDLRAPQHAFHPAAPVVGDHNGGDTLFARTACATGTVLQRFRVARYLDMNDEAQGRKIDTPSCNVGRHTHACAAVSQCLKGLIAFALRMLTRKRDHAEATVLQGRVKAADAFASGAKANCRLSLVKTQQVDDRVFDFRRPDSNALIGDIAMSTRFADQRKSQGVALIAFGQPFDRAGHGGGEEKRAACLGCRVEDFLEIFAKTHVEHFVRFVEYHADKARQVQCAALDMVAQAPRGADDDGRSATQVAPFLARIHPADTGCDAQACTCKKPPKFTADLQRQFARWSDDEHEGGLAQWRAAEVAQQLVGKCQTEGNRLPAAGLSGNDQVATMRFGFGHGLLNGGERLVATSGQSLADHRREVGKRH